MKPETPSFRFQVFSHERLVRFWVSPELKKYEALLRQMNEADIRHNRETVMIKENRLRTVYRTRFSFIESPVLIKSFHFPTVRRVLRGWFAPYADRELANAGAARQRGIPTAKPLFLIRKRNGWRPTMSLLGYQFLEGSSLYLYLSVKEALSYDKRLQLMRVAGEFTALLHERGGIHRDYHAGNLLILKDESLALIDLFPLSFVKSLTEKNRIDGLAHLVASLMPLVGKAGIDELMDGYREATRVPLSAEAEDKIMKRQQEIQRRHEISRSRRCMKNSSQFYQVRFPYLRIAARRDLTVEDIFSFLGDFNTLYREHPENALKNSPESVIFRVDRPGQIPFCVKWYKKRGGLDDLKEWVRGGRVLRAWKAGNGLAARGIPVATPYAMVKTRQGGVLLMEAVEGVELDRLLFQLLLLKGQAVWRLKRNLAEHLGHLMGLLHHKGIFHADMKACNIMVAEEDEFPSVTLMDYDYVRFFDTLPMKLMMKNLVQLNNSIPSGISRSLRLRFLRAYVGNYPDAPSEKDLFRMVWEESRDKSIVYVTDRGDRKESWR